MIDFSKHLKKRSAKLDLNPSSADRWTTCTASPSFIFDNWDKVPPDSDTKWNREGTTAHEVAAAMLESRKPKEDDSYCCPVPVDTDMRWHAWNYAEYVKGLFEPGVIQLLVEQKLPLWYLQGRNAIVDAAVVNKSSLHIVDYKYGEGIIVSPERNLQAVIYAKSVGDSLNLSDDFPVTLHIYQPRGRAAEDSPSHSWATTWGEIQEIAAEIYVAATYICSNHNAEPATREFLKEAKEIKFAPSDKACQYCPAKGFCAARTNMLAQDFAPIKEVTPEALATLPDARIVTPEQLANLVLHGDQVVKWIKDAQDYALTIMKAGTKLPGLKLVTGRGGHRYWTDQQQAAALLLSTTHLREEEVYERKLIGPAAAEKLLGKGKFKKDLTNLIGKPLGQPMIVPESDKRESCLLDGASEFQNLDQEPSTE